MTSPSEAAEKPGAHRAFVAGATGYTGRYVVEALRARDIPTVAHVRPGSRSGPQWRERFTATGASVDETPWESAAMAATIAAQRPSLVFALLGTTGARAKREGVDNPYEAVDYGLSKLLLDACVAASHAPRFVYLSSIGAREDTGNAYLKVRGRLERELRESGLPHLIVRPSFITGSDRDESRPAERLAAVVGDLALGLAALVGQGKWLDKYGSLTGKMLAQGMVELALGATDAQAEADAAAVRQAARAAAREQQSKS